MNNFDAFRPITRRHFWDNYRSPLTCVAFPTSSASASGSTIDIDIQPVLRAAGPVLSVAVTSPHVTLTWTAVENAYAYVVYRATVVGGPFSIVVSGLLDRFFVDTPSIPGTYQYRVTAIEPSFGETEVSNVVSATV